MNYSELLNSMHRSIFYERDDEDDTPIGYQQFYPADGFVYIVSMSSGYYKIGKSIDPVRRIHEFHDPNAKMLIAFPSRNARDSETILHKLFHRQRIERELFELTHEDLQEIILLLHEMGIRFFCDEELD